MIPTVLHGSRSSDHTDLFYTKVQEDTAHVGFIAQLTTYIDAINASLLVAKGYKAATVVAPAGGIGDYVCDGVGDNVEVQAAINAVSAAGGGTVLLLPGIFYFVFNITPKSRVNLIGSGIGQTVIRYHPSATSTNLVYSLGTVNDSLRISGITFDAQDKLDKGIAQLGSGTGIEIDHCDFRNVNCPNTARWVLRLGAINDADVDGSAAHDVLIHHNNFENNDCKTFEVILIPNVRDSWLHHNRFRGNSTSLTDEVSIYGQNVNLRYTDNIHLDWSDYAVGAKESDQVVISGNVFSNTTMNASQRAVRLYNLVNSSCSFNTITLGATGNQGYGIFLQDYNVGRDGHAQRNPNTLNLTVSFNQLTNCYYGIANITASNANFAYKHLTIEHNRFYNCLKSPIRFGPNGSGLTMDIQYLFVRHNVVHSWSGNIEGAISFYGDTSDASKMKNLYVSDNYVVNNTTGASSGAVRVVGATVEELRDNVLTASGSYGALSTVSGGTVRRAVNNIGLNPVCAYDLGNITGATSIDRTNGDTQTATLIGNVTVTVIAGKVKGDILAIVLTQDTTGSRTITWPSNVKKAGGALVLSTAGGSVDVLTLRWDSANWIEVSRSMGVS